MHLSHPERLVDPSPNLTVLPETNRSDPPLQEWLDLQAPAKIILVPTHYTLSCLRGLARYAEGLAGCLCMALDSNSRAGQVIWVKMASAYALRLISRTGKRV